MDIREATPDDFDFLDQLEKACFCASRRFSRKSIRNSILSAHQIVLIAGTDGSRCGSMILMTYKKHMRVYSLAVLPEYQKSGVGSALMNHAILIARRAGYARISLEADVYDERLIRWYENFGFEVE